MALLENPEEGNPTNFGILSFGRLSFCCRVASEELSVLAVDGGGGGGLAFSSSSRSCPEKGRGKSRVSSRGVEFDYLGEDLKILRVFQNSYKNRTNSFLQTKQ